MKYEDYLKESADNYETWSNSMGFILRLDQQEGNCMEAYKTGDVELFAREVRSIIIILSRGLKKTHWEGLWKQINTITPEIKNMRQMKDRGGSVGLSAAARKEKEIFAALEKLYVDVGFAMKENELIFKKGVDMNDLWRLG